MRKQASRQAIHDRRCLWQRRSFIRTRRVASCGRRRKRFPARRNTDDARVLPSAVSNPEIVSGHEPGAVIPTDAGIALDNGTGGSRQRRSSRHPGQYANAWSSGGAFGTAGRRRVGSGLGRDDVRCLPGMALKAINARAMHAMRRSAAAKRLPPAREERPFDPGRLRIRDARPPERIAAQSSSHPAITPRASSTPCLDSAENACTLTLSP